MKKIKESKGNAGQVVLIVLLTSAVIMTLGLSLSRKSVTETKIDTDEELLKQAFNTAESGIDYYMATGTTGAQAYIAPDGKSVADVSVKDIGNTSVLDFGEYTFQNTGSFFWMAAHNEDGQVLPNDPSNYSGTSVNICVNKNFSGALKIDYFYYNGGYKVARAGYNIGANRVNNFEIKSPDGSCPDDRNRYTYNLTGKPVLLVLTPIFDSAKLALIGTANFPIQGKEIQSTGRTGDINDTSGINRSVRELNRYKLPMFMLEGVTAGGNIVGGT